MFIILKRKVFWPMGIALLFVLTMVTSFAADDVTTIQYAFWGNPTSIGVEKDIIDAFEKINPKIKVQPIAVAYGDYHTKLLTLIAGGQAPDVMRIDSYYMEDFIKTKALKNISGLIQQDKLEMASYYQSGLLDCKKGSSYYGLPWGTAPCYLFINVKMFKDAGVEIPSVNWTYEDFIRIIKKLTKGSGAGKEYGYGFHTTSYEHILPLVWGNGGDIFDRSRKKFMLDQPVAYEKIQEVADLIKAGYCPDPAQFSNPDVLNRWMTNYKLAIRIGTATDILSLQKVDNFDFEVLPFPGTAKYPNVTIYKSNVVGISASTKKEKAAWAFLKFLRAPGEQGEVLYMQAKRIPPTFDNPELWKIYADPTKSPKMVVQVSKAIADRYGHTLPLRSGWMEIQGLLLPQLQRVYSGQINAAQAMKEIAPKINEVLKRNN